uniref:Uncharacterized protein n=1 Tax=Arundo donax TaxID=35708 RepID=A0A0A9BIM5_ARUDO
MAVSLFFLLLFHLSNLCFV